MCTIVSIIVTYNGEKWIKKCLDSLLLSTIKTDIYIIDNHSTDHTVSIIENYSDIQILKNEINLGFGRANNVLLKKLYKENKYSYFFLINQDAWVDPYCIQNLIEFATNHTKYGIVSPMQYNHNFATLDFNFKEYISKGKQTIDKTIINTSFVNAAIWLISKNCLEKTGLFNPYFSHYGEDKNYCNRVENAGFKIGIVKSAKANHDRDKTIDFNKIVKLSKIKLDCIILNPSDHLVTGYLKALINTMGIPKYYYKMFSMQDTVSLFYYLFIYYIKLLFSKKIKTNRKEQNKGLFSIY